MRVKRSYLLPLLAIISLAAIAAYELYWIKGLYKTRQEAAVSEIRVSITWAEMEELISRRKQSSDSVHFSTRVYSGSNGRLPKIISTQSATPGDSIKKLARQIFPPWTASLCIVWIPWAIRWRTGLS